MNFFKFTSRSVKLAIFGGLFAAVTVNAQSEKPVDAKARQVAEATIDRMGGEDRWADIRYLVWENFGQTHYWDKWAGDFRWERDSLTSVMNIHSMQGRFWIEGVEVKDEAELKNRLENVYSRWVNNSYWLIMPYKLLDPGVNLAYMGEEKVGSGQMADVLEMTFEGVGLTPDNKYLVYVDKETGLVCQWTHWRSREDDEPRFTRPWSDWVDHNGVMFSMGRGDQGLDIARLELPEELPEGLFSGLRY